MWRVDDVYIGEKGPIEGSKVRFALYLHQVSWIVLLL